MSARGAAVIGRTGYVHLRLGTPTDAGAFCAQDVPVDEEFPVGFRLFPRVRRGFHVRRTFRAGPLRLHVGSGGVSWGLGVGRWSWNATSRRHTVDTPGPGSWQSRGRRR